MCGISGIINLNKRPIDNLEAKIKLMTKMLDHRGPDQNGIYIYQKINLVQLATIDWQ